MSKQKNTKKVKKHFSIYWLLGKIGDILFIPVLLVSLFSSISMLIQNRNRIPTQIFGYSLVNILSPSMTSSGFKVGDTVITVKTNEQNIALGDVIAFYEMRNDPSDKKTRMLVKKFLAPETIKTLNPTNDVETKDEGLIIYDGVLNNTYEKVEREHQWTVEYAQKLKKRIIFHMVIGIYVDEDGYVFYETKGTSSGMDSGLIRSDLVVGEYVNTPRVLRDVMSFCASPMGMIVLVCVPLSILVLFQCLSIIKQVEIMNLEKQLINGKKKYNEKDIIETFNGNDMELYNKIYYYYLVDESERDDVLNFMWSDILYKENPNKKEKALLNNIEKSAEYLQNSVPKYWEYWIENIKGYDKKRAKKYYEEISLLKVLKDTNKTTEDASNN